MKNIVVVSLSRNSKSHSRLHEAEDLKHRSRALKHCSDIPHVNTNRQQDIAVCSIRNLLISDIMYCDTNLTLSKQRDAVFSSNVADTVY